MTKEPREYRWAVLLVGAFIVSAVCSQRARGQSEAPELSLQQVQNTSPSFLVRVDVDRPSREYLEGETLKITAVSERDGYLYALYQQADGKRRVIFPNKIQSDNRIHARQVVSLPAPADRFSWVVAPPYGEEVIKIIVSSEPLRTDVLASSQDKLFAEIGKDALKGMQVDLLTADPSSWAEHHVGITTRSPSTPPQARQPKRLGVFVGVSHYRYNAEFEILSQGETDLNLPTCHRDANQLAELMKDRGRLDAVRVLTNENATKENIQEAIASWLPEQSSPGDEIFIYFSGHGGKDIDLSSDEGDSFDETILPHDCANGQVFDSLYRQLKAQLDRDEKPDLRIWGEYQPLMEIVGYKNFYEHREKDPRADRLIRQRTQITDDVLGQWILDLDDRKVVVILDSCFAGGFAEDESADKSKASGAEGLMKSVIPRLKDIGYNEAILLTSSSYRVVSQCRFDNFPAERGPLSVATSYLIEGLLGSQGEFSVQDAFQHCDSGMLDYFSDAPAERRHQPQLWGAAQKAPC